MIKRIYAYTIDEIKFLDAEGIRYQYIIEVEDITDDDKAAIQNDPDIILCLEAYTTIDSELEEKGKVLNWWRVVKAKYNLHDVGIQAGEKDTTSLVSFSLNFDQYEHLIESYKRKILKTSGSFGDLLLKQIYLNTKSK